MTSRSATNFFRTPTGAALSALLGYTAIALAMSWPLAIHFRSFALAGLEDGSMSIWNLWWMKYSLFELGQSPLHSDFLLFPDGVSLTFHSLPKVLGLLSVPLQYLAGATVAYNCILLLTFIVTGMTTCWLVYHLLGERVPAFLAGAFFAFSPVRWDHLGHLQLLSTMLIPVYVLLLIKGRQALEAGGRLPWVWFSLAGVALAVTAYDTEYYSIFLILFSALYLFYYLPLKSGAGAWKRWAGLLAGITLAGAVFAVLFLPMLLAARGEIAARGDYVTFPASWAPIYARNMLSFFIPQQHSHYLGSQFASLNRHPEVDTTFLGWLAVLLALAGVWRYRRRRDTWLWVLTALASAALVLGPDVTVIDRVITSSGPFLIITRIPVINAVRVPARFGIITMFAVAVLAGYGASALCGFVRRRGWAAAAIPAATAVILLGIFVEYKPLYHLTRTTAPAAYGEIARSSRPGSVMTLPLGWEGGSDQAGTERTYTELFQLEHQRPMIGGMLARVPREQVFKGEYTPVIDFLADPAQLEPSGLDLDPKAIAAFKERYQVSFIVVHKQPPEIIFRGSATRFPPDFSPEALDRVDNYVTAHLGFEKFAEDEEVVAYRLP